MSNKIFIAASLDGYIADNKGEIKWLDYASEKGNEDMGYVRFNESIDALIMGRNTYDMVRSFGGEWPYDDHVYVLSTTLTMEDIPSELSGKITITKGTPAEIMSKAHASGHKNLYIDGGVTIQRFLKEDLIDEMILTVIPVLLGGGSPLFGELSRKLWFECYSTEIFQGGIMQSKYKRIQK